MRYSFVAVLAAAGTAFAAVDDSSSFEDATAPSGYVVSQIVWTSSLNSSETDS